MSKKALAILLAALVVVAVVVCVIIFVPKGDTQNQAEEPAAEITAEVQEEATPAPAEESAEEATEAPAEESAEEATEAPAEEAAEAPAEEATEAPAEESAETPAEEPAEVQAEAEVTPVPDTLLVTVNGQEIHMDDDVLQYYYESALASLDADDEEAKHVARMYAMNNALQIKLVSQKASEYYSEEDYEAFRAEAKAEWDEIVEEFMMDLGITEESSEEERIAARGDVLGMLESTYGYTEEKYVSEGLENLVVNSYYDVIAEDVKAADPSLAATDEEIQQLYDQYVAEEIEYIGNDAFTYEMYQMYGYNLHYVPEGYRGITHILLEVDQELLDNWVDLSARLEENTDGAEATGEDGAADTTETAEPVTAEMVEEARLAIIASQQEKIDEIMKKLEEGAVFEDLIAEYGIDPGMEDAENLANGYPVHKDSITYVQQFTDGSAALEKVGDVSEPIVTPYGIHILHYLRDIPAGAMEMTDEIKDDLREEVEYDRVNDAIFAQIDKWQQEADIVWTEAGKEWEYDEELFNAYIAGMGAADEDVPAETEEVTEEPAGEAVEETVEETAAP